MITRRGFLEFILAAPAALKIRFNSLIPAEMPISPPVSSINYYELNAMTMECLRDDVIYDNFFRDDPMMAKLRSGAMESFDGGTEL